MTSAKNSERDDFLAGVCVALQIVSAADNATLWRTIVMDVGVAPLLRYAAFVEPDEWDLAGFQRYAITELKRRRPRNCTPEDESKT